MANLALDFALRALKIVLIDVTLAGDNAVVIALAVKSLPEAQRRTGILAGAAGAIALRILLTFFASRLLSLPWFKLAGGVLILWIAVKLLTDTSAEEESRRQAGSLRQAIWMILVADLTMSTDNVLAVAAASEGSLALLITGLVLSISFVMFMSGFLARMMDRYPVIVWVGAAILGQVAGNMIATDPKVSATPAPVFLYSVEAGLALLVLITGLAIKKMRKNSARPSVS